MRKIKVITNWFKVLRFGSNGSLKASTYRQIRKDLEIVTHQLETTVGYHLVGNQFNTQRMRTELMIQMVDQAEEILQSLTKAGSVHNCFSLRFRIEKLRDFLKNYNILLNKYNNKFLEKVHGALEINFSNGLLIGTNLISKGEEEVEIIK